MFALGDAVEVGLHLLQQAHAQFGVRHLAAAEAQGDLDLVAFFEEPVHGLGLHLVVVDVDLRAELDLLDLDDLLALARLVLLFLFLELVLAVIQDLHHRGIGVRHDLDQIETGLLSRFQSRRDRHDALLFAVLIDQQDLGDSDLVVDARSVLDGGRLHGAANGRCSVMVVRLRYMTARPASIKRRRGRRLSNRRYCGAPWRPCNS
ncbi:MAG: hypothetical protein JWM33_1639, partial [Caulobacteraceae bacterium]|nr:hypothetical protein [Caulobacteraceae bacterium]